MRINIISMRFARLTFIILCHFIVFQAIGNNIDRLKACKNASELSQAYEGLHDPDRTVTAFYHMRLYELVKSRKTVKLLLNDIPTPKESSYYFPYGFYKIVVALLPGQPRYLLNYLRLIEKRQGNADESYCDSIGPLILNCGSEFFQELDKCPIDTQNQILGCLELASWEENSRIRRMVFTSEDISMKWKMWFQNDVDMLLIDILKGQNLKLISELLEEGADPLAKDRNGKNAITYAKELKNGKLLNLLRKYAKKEDNSGAACLSR